MIKGTKRYLSVILLLSAVGCSNKNVNVPLTPEVTTSDVDRVSYHTQLNYTKPNIYVAKPIPYLAATKSLQNKTAFFSEKNEKKILNFYKDLNARGYGDFSPYWRWHFSMTEKELEHSLNKNLPIIAKSRPKEIFTYVNGKWERGVKGNDPVGILREIKVLERGKSGVITQLLIVGSKGTYLVAKEGNIRSVIKLKKESIGTDREIIIKGAKGGETAYTRTLSKNSSMLPSAFFAIEKRGNEYNFYGGGYGHGVGMPQWSAYDLGKNHNYSYKNILKKYYSKVSFKNMYSLSGVGKTIRIGINTTGFKSLDHDRGVFSSLGKFTLVVEGKNITVKPREKVEVINRGGVLIVKVNGKEVRKTKATVTLKPSKELIGIETIKRNTKKTAFPIYRGKMEIKPSNVSGKIRIINEVEFEDYLLQVVSSEMGANFGLEALKAQAVAARTYALKDYFGNKYKSQGFHIDDSTKSQVYNNKDETEIATKAIRATKGEVMLYDNKPIDAKYYSTSAGFGAAAHNIW